MYTALSDILVFKLFRAEAATSAVTTSAIVITLDIIKHRCPHYFPIYKALTVDTFDFQWVEEAFHTSIVITAAFRTHIATQVVSLQFEFELTKEWEGDQWGSTITEQQFTHHII